MELLEIERRLSQLIDQFDGGLPAEQVADMKCLVDAGEPGVALENYCSQLYEYEIDVPLRVKNELAQLGRAMGIESKYWERLGM